jgi:hypothetical protein
MNRAIFPEKSRFFSENFRVRFPQPRSVAAVKARMLRRIDKFG